MKTVINLFQWRLVANQCIFLTGIAEDHPRLGKNASLAHTSEIINIKEDKEGITCETHNSIYSCKYKDWDLNNTHVISINSLQNLYLNISVEAFYTKYLRIILYGIRTKRIKHFQSDDSMKGTRISKEEKHEYDNILNLATIGVEEYKKRIIEQEKQYIEEAKKYNNCIYINLTTITRGDKAAFHIDNESGFIEPKLHSGMFSDTVLYTNINKGIDFRYYVGYADMTPYMWSDNIEKIIIHNSKGYPITFNRNIVIGANETKIINKGDIEKK